VHLEPHTVAQLQVRANRSHPLNQKPSATQKETQISTAIFVVPYFGDLPVWFPATLHSCAQNPEFDWLFILDSIPEEFLNSGRPIPIPKNLHFIESTLQDFVLWSSQKLNTSFELQRAYKVCDLRPVFGEIFNELIGSFDFWGYTDIDIIWGQISSFATPEVLSQSDIISSVPGGIRGHFTLLRNCETINQLYLSIPNYISNLNKFKECNMDERGLNHLLVPLVKSGKLKACWHAVWLNYKLPPKQQLRGMAHRIFPK
jgi:hypothetical protein